MKTSPDNKQAASCRHTQQGTNFTRKRLAMVMEQWWGMVTQMI